MKICIFGAGAIGGYMGVKLAQIGTDVSLVARGPHLEAMKKNGLRLIEGESDLTVPVEASENPEDLGIQDYLIITLKAHSVPSIIEKTLDIVPALGAITKPELPVEISSILVFRVYVFNSAAVEVILFPPICNVVAFTSPLDP